MPKIAYVGKRFKEDSLEIIGMANSILLDYEAQGYDMTLRQVYYRFVALDAFPDDRRWRKIESTGRWVRDPNGTKNADPNYTWLGAILNDARLAGLVDWNHMVDRTRFLRTVSSWNSPEAIIRGAASGYQRDLWEDQPVRVEVWVEKDALVGVIERASEHLRVPFLSCRGYTSQSEMWGASQRFGGIIDRGQKVVVLHLGDHDPSGIDMSRDIEERILHFLSSDYYHANDVEPEEAVEWAADNFELRRLALNWDQVQQYDPPPNPAKLSDSRGAGYVERFGSQSWELDALEPTVMGALIQEAVEDLRDEDVWQDAAVVEETEKATIQVASSRWPEVAAFLNGAGEGE